mmetsp:Transcript_44694/g.51424  ORF Transcript_44694/g.51424 Transcript_44694/m.51424 type:complete len:220 (-) Transcript_44694:365-1024(-)|eukprot:CAMPEP_0115007312 /NCGR_PEP_ID=MMETSP0216-20121206/21093_1 /TAXON_ID=223996 /ORGANISM="Protocruzia adherens, Strain Boccale" /LENGTH=219 /DNA_ID=CAMNT_0002374207 /DNA_START=35 /DNA_END=694 /DNA_ORIENTATION=+
MEKYFTTTALLGMRDQNLPGSLYGRQKRYQSIEKMLDLLDIAFKTNPRVPVEALFLDPHDDEWEDDMTYMSVDYNSMIKAGLVSSAVLGTLIYNANHFAYNPRHRFTKLALNAILLTYGYNIYTNYRFQYSRAMMFDEYVNARADELIQQNTPIFKTESMKKFVWWSEDLRETLYRVHKQSSTNTPKDWADSEVLLQDFIRRYTDEKAGKPLQWPNVGH